MKGGRCVGLRTAGETIEADMVAVTAGAGAQAIVAPAGDALAVATTPGLLLHTAPLPAVLQRIIVGPGMDVRQTLAGGIIIGSDFGGSPITGEPETIAAALLDTLRQRVRGAENAGIIQTIPGSAGATCTSIVVVRSESCLQGWTFRS
jgi:glycine/D-amino acid oxidase-like deaminating enzyme